MMLLSTVHDDRGPKDPFKTTHVLCNHKKDIAENVQRINHFKCEANNSMRAGSVMRSNPRWTETIYKLSTKRSVYEENPIQRESLLRYEQLPMPSFFNPTGKFQDPPNYLKSK